MNRILKIRVPALGLLALVVLGARGDESDTIGRWPDHELEFARMIYSLNSYRPGNGDAFTDFPEAETFFSLGVGRLTRVDIGRRGVNFRLSDDILFNYPWLYAVEVGNWYLDDHDAARLREYLLRGGFLMVDDFHGTAQWAGFIESMTRVFPRSRMPMRFCTSSTTSTSGYRFRASSRSAATGSVTRRTEECRIGGESMTTTAG